MEDQTNLEIKTALKTEVVSEHKFEPIRGFPMLRWQGKRPFTSTQFYPAQLKEVYGEDVEGWSNKIFWGDNLQVMSHLLKEFRAQIDLIYIDPPFDSKADYKKKIRLKGQDVTNDQSTFEEKQYTDIWVNDEYLQFIYERIILLRELLSDTGQIYVHIDSTKGHHLRCIMDEIFGPANFKSEIIWYYENKLGTGGNTLDSRHDSILCYAKGKNWTHNQILLPVKETKMQPVTQKIDNKRVWLKDEEGKRLYQESKAERPIGDVWNIPIINPVANERLGYPTQKPEKLLEYIVRMSSNPGDLVFDCFMGSGTTQAVCMKNGRRFIGADINLGAIQISTKRLLKLKSEVETTIQDQKIFPSFQVYNVNHYDVFRNPAQAKDLLIKALEIQPMPGNSIYDGEKDGMMVKILPINRIATRADLNELITGFDYRTFEKRNEKNPGKPVESILLICMGHEPDLGAHLKAQVKAAGYLLEVEVVDILRSKANLEFKRDSEVEVVIEGDKIVVRQFYPMNLLQKLSMMKEAVTDWRELVESVMIDFNYDGAVLEPQLVDVPPEKELVRGFYPIPAKSGTIRIKITDLLSESLEVTING